MEKRECSVCGQEETRDVDKKAHSFGEWVRDKEPTNQEEGNEYRECSECHCKENRSVAKLSSGITCLATSGAGETLLFLSLICAVALLY